METFEKKVNAKGVRGPKPALQFTVPSPHFCQLRPGDSSSHAHPTWQEVVHSRVRFVHRVHLSRQMFATSDERFTVPLIACDAFDVGDNHQLGVVTTAVINSLTLQ